MARQLAITAECLSCAEGTGGTVQDQSTDTGGTLSGPSIIPRQIPLPDSSGAGLPIERGDTPVQPVTPGTSALPSTVPQVLPSNPNALPTATPLPWRKIGWGVALLLAALWLTGADDRRTP